MTKGHERWNPPTVLWQVAEPWQGLGLCGHSLTICSENQTKCTIPSESFEGDAINRSAIGVYKDNYKVTLDLDLFFEELGCNYTQESIK